MLISLAMNYVILILKCQTLASLTFEEKYPHSLSLSRSSLLSMHSMLLCHKRLQYSLNYSLGFSNSSIISEFIVSPQLSVIEEMATVAAVLMKSQRSVGHKGAEEPDKMAGQQIKANLANAIST